MNLYYYWCGKPLKRSTTKPKVTGEYVYQCPTPNCSTKIETDELFDNNEV